jgi:hypothetical protein
LFGYGIERGRELFKFVAAGDGYAGLKLSEGNTTGGLLELGKWHEIATNLNKPEKENDPDSQEEYQEEAGGEAHEGSQEVNHQFHEGKPAGVRQLSSSSPAYRYRVRKPQRVTLRGQGDDPSLSEISGAEFHWP